MGATTVGKEIFCRNVRTGKGKESIWKGKRRIIGTIILRSQNSKRLFF